MPTTIDAILSLADNALRTVFANHHPQRACPQGPIADEALSEQARREASALMRVNHVGEVCAQALYASQALATQNPALKAHFQEASQEETDHLAWTEQRLSELGGRTSLLNPLWYPAHLALACWLGNWGEIGSVWASWWRPSAKWKPICSLTWTAYQRGTTPRGPSCIK